MDIEPIKTDQEYELALSVIEEIWGSRKNTPEGDRVDILITLVEAYERKKHPIYTPGPIAAIRQCACRRSRVPIGSENE